MTQPALDIADFRLLRVFVTIVERGGFAAAELALGLSLSTISGQMKALETRLGLRLCTRGRAGFRLTEAGEAVYAEARQLIAASEGFSTRVAGLKDRLAGPVRIGTLDATLTDPRSCLPKALAAYAAVAPESELRVVTQPPDALLRDISDTVLDVAIGSFPRIALGLTYVDLYREQHLFYAGATHPLYSTPDAMIDYDEVRRHRLIGRRYWGARDLKIFAGTRVGATVSEMESEAILVLSGAFLGYLPDHYAQPWVAAGRMRPLAPDRFGYVAPFQLAFRPDRIGVPRIAALVEAIAAAHGARLPHAKAGRA